MTKPLLTENQTREPETMEPVDTSAADNKQQIAHSVHALRNGMNSLVMNAAVLASRTDDLPESLRPFLECIAQAGQRCSEELARLYALIDARNQGPPPAN